jgi:hypothetical protein
MDLVDLPLYSFLEQIQYHSMVMMRQTGDYHLDQFQQQQSSPYKCIIFYSRLLEPPVLLEAMHVYKLQVLLHSHYYPTREQWMDVIEDAVLDIKFHFEHLIGMHHLLDT